MRRATWFFVTACVLAVSCCGGSARAEDFRVDTDYYVGNEKKPSAEVLTIFQGGIAYDFQGVETMVLDPRRGKLTLLDSERKVRADLETAELLDAATSLQAVALDSKNPALVAAAKPEFQKSSEDFQQNGGQFTRLTFQSAPLRYIVEAQAARTPEAVQEYKYFVDWSARLNSLRPGGQPAGARLEINEDLAAKGLIPTRIDRVIPDARIREVRAQHSVIWKLSQDDHSRIDKTGTQLVKFQLVSFDQYIKINKTAKR